jgi:hypothetical protein
LKESDLLVYLKGNKIILPDKGYQGQPNCLTPFKYDPTPQEEALNEIFASVRILVECVIKRIKTFGILGSRGRFHSNNLFKHRAAFKVACQITNISLDYEPVWSTHNFFLRNSQINK